MAAAGIKYAGLGTNRLYWLFPSRSDAIFAKTLKIVATISLLTGFSWLGEWLAIGLSLTIPGPVIGMVILFACLCLLKQPVAELNRLSHLGIRNLSLLFIPAAVGIFFVAPELYAQLPRILLMIVISTLLTVVLLCLVVKLILRLSGEKGSHG